MTVEKQPRKRRAYGLPANVEAIVATSTDVAKIMASGIRADGSLKPEAIRALLKAKAVDIKAFSELHGITDATTHQVINRQRRIARIEDMLAAALGMDPDRVWGRQPVEQSA